MTRFGKYVLEKKLASGGMAEVYAARVLGPAGFEKRVALKHILPELSSEPEFVEMFGREARLAAQLQHSNIVQVFDFGQENGIYFLAMELVEGYDLRRLGERLRERHLRLPIRLSLYIATEMLRGLQYAHTRGVVHRDVSPHNVLLSPAGEVKLTDFGIARAATLPRLTRTGVIKGKLGYMSPEQFRGGAADARSDIYATGVVLHELLTGKPLFADVAGQLAPEARPGHRPVSISEALPAASPELARAVDRLLAPEPGDRPASASAALAELFACPDGVGRDDELAAFISDTLEIHDAATQPFFAPGLGAPPPAVLEEEPEVIGSDPDAPTHTRAIPVKRAAVDGPRGSAGTVHHAGRPSAHGSDDRVNSAAQTDSPSAGPLDAATPIERPITPAMPGRTPRPSSPSRKLRTPAANTPEAYAEAAAETAAMPVAARRRRASGSGRSGGSERRAAGAHPIGARGHGLLEVNAPRGTEVWVDGVLMGVTPHRSLRLAEGPHQVELRHPALGAHESLEIIIERSRWIQIERSWERSNG